jgi:hypothetical protein
MRRVELWLPILPKQELSANGSRKTTYENGVKKVKYVGRSHSWQLRYPAELLLKTDTMNLIRERWAEDDIPRFDVCSVVITMRLRSRGPSGFYRPIDVWNAAAPMKPVIDGMKEVGMFPDDDFKHIPLGATAIERIGKDEPEGLFVVITEIGEPTP